MRRLNDFVLSTARNRGSPRAMPASIAHERITGALGARGVVLIAADETGGGVRWVDASAPSTTEPTR